MSEPEKFLDRWSRRKRKAADEPAPAAAKDPTAAALPPVAGANAPAAEAPFDPASLPPIESISANSDIRAFLQPGVPPDLSRAALRRAWSADPAEGEAMTEAGNDLVETVPMPKAIQEAVANFVAEHHVERTFTKRKRDRADPEALGRRAPLRDDEQR